MTTQIEYYYKLSLVMSLIITATVVHAKRVITFLLFGHFDSPLPSFVLIIITRWSWSSSSLSSSIVPISAVVLVNLHHQYSLLWLEMYSQLLWTWHQSHLQSSLLLLACQFKLFAINLCVCICLCVTLTQKTRWWKR